MAAEIKTEQTHRYVIEIPALSISGAEWEGEALKAPQDHPIRAAPQCGCSSARVATRAERPATTKQLTAS